MLKPFVILAVTVALTALAPSVASSQESPLLLEVHGGYALPVGSFADGDRAGEGAAGGPSLSVLLARPGAGRRTTYVGFSQHRFDCVDAGCSVDGRYVATGFNLGMRVALLRGHAAIPWVRVGAITTRVETDDLGGADTGVSALGFGGEAGVGVYVGAASSVALNPAVTFSAVNSELPGGSTLRLRFVTAHLGVVLAF